MENSVRHGSFLKVNILDASTFIPTANCYENDIVFFHFIKKKKIYIYIYIYKILDKQIFGYLYLTYSFCKK